MNNLYPTILKKFIMPIVDTAMNTKLMRYYHRIKKMRTWSSGEIDEWQNKRLRRLIKHAYHHTQYYRNLFDDLGLSPEDVRERNDLKKIPILTKEIIRNNFDKLIPDNIESIPHLKSSTGGSTGTALDYLADKKTWSFIKANTIVNWEKTEYNYGDPYVALGSSSLFVNKSKDFKHWLYYKLKHKIGLNGVNMSTEVCENYVGIIQEHKIEFLYGYASAIYLLAKYILENNISISLSACFPTSEVLTDFYRKKIKKAFDCKVVDSYGARDGGVTAFEHLKGFYEVGYNSIVRLNDKSKKGVGEALLTDTLNSAMPMINYKLGDALKIDHELNKEYNYNGQILNKIIGRESDLLRLGNGRVLTGPGFTVLFRNLPVEAYRIEKVGPKNILCKDQTLQDFSSEHEKIIVETLKKQAGSEIKIEVEYVKEGFDLKESGKRDYFITE